MSVKFARVTQPLQYYWKQYPALAWVMPLLWLLAIAAVTLVWHVSSIGLIDETEPLFVEASRQMVVTGDWVTPYVNGEPRFDKPPLIYWLMVFAFQSFGVNEFAARLPSILAAVAIALFCFYILQRYEEAEGRRQKAESERTDSLLTPLQSGNKLHFSPSYLAALLAATMLILNPNTFFWGRTGYADMLLNACIGSSLLAFFLGYAQPDRPLRQKRWYFAFYVLMALAVLTKGPIGLLLPGLIIGCFLLYVGNGRAVLREMQLLRGGLVVLIIALPWYVLVTLANGDAFIDSFFGYHNVERFTQVVNSHAGPWYFHILVIVVGFLPWSAYLPAAIAHIKPLQRRYWQRQPRWQQLGLFALFWFLAILGFFTIATTKYFSYTLPLMPAAAILVALLWTDYVRRPQTRKQAGFIISGVLNLLLLAIAAFVLIESPRWLGSDPWMPNLGLRLQQADLPFLGGVIWGTTAIAAIGLLLWRSRWLWITNLLGYLAFLILVVHPLVLIADVERQLPLRQLAQVAVQTKQPTEELVMLGFQKPSLVFYTRQHVTYLTQPTEVINYLQTQPGDRTGALVVAGEKPLRRSGLQPQQYQEISRAGVYRLVRVAGQR
ncbi:glycosyltransferase family 39 protein [Leptolyngbya sp. FACHB-321]|uniref:ArnT family glycosyltransferase n=1 Tax=Leptolyngbya sp. FACHB-321 TaxID=2692807 RepID=UPI001682AC38|nr:glycosyltransferase family 39 protein [Leptolyngbya sp. FACHB-321]MBD2038687.1 glycosyltransferase family 39 protein [Leptolyngbya sp. FACHB-321]